MSACYIDCYEFGYVYNVIVFFKLYYNLIKWISNMLNPILHVLNTKRIVLASASPRRQEIIKNIGLNILLCPSTFEENLDPETFESVEEFVKETALQKVLEVDNRLKVESNDADIIIGADTMVTVDGKIFGKPKDSDDAIRMLNIMNGKYHTVHTGVIVKNGPEIVKFYETTKVLIGKLLPEQIKGYVDMGEPLDKAGAYGIQGLGGTLIEKIEGDYFNVVGLPLHKLCCVLFDMFYDKTK